METKFTPGPWLPMVDGNESNQYFRIVGGLYRATVANTMCGIHAQADAALIAAAPDLLESIRPLLFEVEQLLIATKHFPECAVKMSRRCAVEQAQAAIQRATEGRT